MQDEVLMMLTWNAEAVLKSADMLDAFPNVLHAG